MLASPSFPLTNIFLSMGGLPPETKLGSLHQMLISIFCEKMNVGNVTGLIQGYLIQSSF